MEQIIRHQIDAMGARVLRTSIPLWTSPDSRFDPQDRYRRMFLEDVSRDVFPYGGKVGRTPIFSFSCEDATLHQLIGEGFRPMGPGAGYRSDPSAELAGFGSTLIYHLLDQGSAVLEVAPVLDSEGEAHGFFVYHVNDVWSLGPWVWQIAEGPEPDHVKGRLPGRVLRGYRIIRLPRDRVITVKLPSEYDHLPIRLRGLRHMGTPVPKFVVENLGPDGEASIPYDLQTLKEVDWRAVATVTQATGWNARGSFSETQTSYYTMDRYLRYWEFLIELREVAVEAANTVLQRAGRLLNFDCSVQLKGMPTWEEFETARVDLEEGTFDSADALKQFSPYLRGRGS